MRVSDKRSLELLRDPNPSIFQEVQTARKHMWGRLEVVAKKINELVFLDWTQEKVPQTTVSR